MKTNVMTAMNINVNTNSLILKANSVLARLQDKIFHVEVKESKRGFVGEDEVIIYLSSKATGTIFTIFVMEGGVDVMHNGLFYGMPIRKNFTNLKDVVDYILNH